MTPQQANLAPCPFCGGAARIHSNNDWHRLWCNHTDDCMLDADEADLMYPAQPGYLLEIAEVWNRRAPAPTEPAVDRDAVGVLRSFWTGAYWYIVSKAECEAINAAFAALATPASPAVPPKPTHECIVREGDVLTCTACGTSTAASELDLLAIDSPPSEFDVKVELSLPQVAQASQPETTQVPASERLFRKKPVTVEAIQWTGKLSCLDPFFIPELHQAFCSDKVGIPTLEGTMIASVGDWIIKGVKGEFYPCKPDVFAMTYEQASQPNSAVESPGVNIDRVHNIMAGYNPKPPPPRPQRPPGPLWTDAERERFRENMKRGERCPICSVIEGGQHFPGCSRGVP